MTVPDAASYAPVTILVDERADGVHLSCDSMASLIAPYGSQANVILPDIDKLVFSGAPAPANLPDDEKIAYERLSFVYAKKASATAPKGDCGRRRGAAALPAHGNRC